MTVCRKRMATMARPGTSRRSLSSCGALTVTGVCELESCAINTLEISFTRYDSIRVWSIPARWALTCVATDRLERFR
jgi:hypothetical protein